MELHLFSADAVVESVENRRPGARHAMLIFVVAEDSEAAQRNAISAATAGGWMMVNIKRSKVLDPDPTLVEDEILSGAMEVALAEGSAIVVYADEIPADA